MPEGASHVALINEILTILANDGYAEYIVLTDRAGEYTGNRCPNIGGFVPDVYAVAARDIQHRTIGEAKSIADLNTPHSHRQLKSFARHLSIFERPTLILAVPFVALPGASTLLKRFLSEYQNIASLIIAPSIQRVITHGWRK